MKELPKDALPILVNEPVKCPQCGWPVKGLRLDLYPNFQYCERCAHIARMDALKRELAKMEKEFDYRDWKDMWGIIDRHVYDRT